MDAQLVCTFVVCMLENQIFLLQCHTRADLNLYFRLCKYIIGCDIIHLLLHFLFYCDFLWLGETFYHIKVSDWLIFLVKIFAASRYAKHSRENLQILKELAETQHYDTKPALAGHYVSLGTQVWCLCDP